MKLIFISHKETDQEVAEKLVNLVLAALDVQDNEVLCTSVPGHQLNFGSSISGQLKANLYTSTALIAVLTPESIKATWVLFELGAAWAMNKIVVPILGPGLKFIDLPAALSDCPGVRIDEKNAPVRVMDAMNQIAVALSVKEKTGGKVQSKLDDFVNTFRSLQPSEPTQASASAASKSRTIELSAQAKELLTEAAQDSSGIIGIFQGTTGRAIITNGKSFEGDGTPRTASIWQGALRQLEQNGLIRQAGMKGHGFTVTDLGYQLAEEYQADDKIQGGESGNGDGALSEKDCVLLLQQWLSRKRGSGLNVERFADVDRFANVPPGSAKSYLAIAAKEVGVAVDTEADQTIRIDYNTYP